MSKRIIVKMTIPNKPTKSIIEPMIICPMCNISRTNNLFNFPSKTDRVCKWCLSDKHSKATRQYFDNAHDTRKKFLNSCH